MKVWIYICLILLVTVLPASETSYKSGYVLVNNDSDQDAGQPDHADKVVNGPNDCGDLTKITVQLIPAGMKLKKDARFSVSVSDVARPFVNLFYLKSSKYIYIGNPKNRELSTGLLKNGIIDLFVEANSYPRPDWDGSVSVTFRLENRGKKYTQSKQLRVAPFIMISAVQKARRIYVREFPKKNEAFINGLKAIVPQLGVELRIIPAGTYKAHNIWLQDVMEVGYSVRPDDFNGSNGKDRYVVLRANRGKTLDDMPQQKILGPDHGWFRVGDFKPETGKGRGGDSWLDWYGNLEVTPPLPGKPFGRIFYGYNKYSGKSLNPQIVEMLEAQAVQTPSIKIHTGWLLIKHVDEIFNFVKIKTASKGYKVLVPDARVAYRLLEQWRAQSKGHLPMLKDLKKGETIASVLSNRELKEYNMKLQQDEVEFSIGQMKDAIGLDENDLIRIPVLFEKTYGFAGCLTPNMVNSIHMNGHQIISDPRGPIENGKDLLREYMWQLLKQEGITAHFVDDLPYHVWGGNAHCATNVTYEPYAVPWWE